MEKRDTTTKVMLIKENIKLGLALLSVSEISPLLSLQEGIMTGRHGAGEIAETYFLIHKQ